MSQIALKVAGVAGLAAFIAYMVTGNYAAASWAGIAALSSTVRVWGQWRDHRR